MKKFLILFVVFSGFLVACSQNEPPADTAGLMHKDEAPSDSGDSSGTPKAPPTDTKESSSEGG
ncbi:MAG: hypothetical protein KF836_02355 [Fimbriimonadaceae bacterium]|nr:hypothetical protein [Fimbriimonadaceae bacterium]